jgi:hypothetical protein
VNDILCLCLLRRRRSLLLGGDITNAPHIQLVEQSADECVRHVVHLDADPALGVVLDGLRGVLMDEHVDDAHLFVGAEGHVEQEMLTLLAVLRLLLYLLLLLLLLLLLQVVLRLGLGHLHRHLLNHHVLPRPPPLVRRVLHLHKRHIVTDHLLCHLLQLLGLLVHPLRRHWFT